MNDIKTTIITLEKKIIGNILSEMQRSSNANN